MKLLLPGQEGILKVTIRRRPEMPHRPVILRRRSQVMLLLLLLMVVVEGSRHRHKRQEVIGIRPGSRMQEMSRHRGASKEVVSRVSRACRSCPAAAGTTGGNPLHALEVKTILLQVASDVFPGQPINAHELHYGLRNRVLDPKVRHGVNKPLVELRGPNQTRPLESSGRFLAAVAGAQLAGISKIGG